MTSSHPRRTRSPSRSATCRARGSRRRSTARSPASSSAPARFRRRFAPHSFGPATVLSSINTILHERQLEEYYCTLCYAVFDLKRRTVVLANSGLPYPLRCSEAECAPVEIAGVPLGAFAGSRYDEITFDLHKGDLFVFCTDGVYDAMNAEGRSSAPRPSSRSSGTRTACRRAKSWTGSSPPSRPSAATSRPNDDMTTVAVRITS